MNPEEVGKKIKELYPQYADMPDAVLGQKFILKHGDKGLQSLGLGTPNQGKDTATLRKEFSQETKNLGFKELQSSWDKVNKAEKTGAGDLTVVYSYIKALDPTTAVREGEINLTKAAESIPSNIIRAYKKAREGKVISPELRSEMIAEVGRMYNERAKKQQELNSFYSGLATDQGLDPQKIIGGVGEVKMAEIPSQPVQVGQPSKESALGNLLLGLGKSVAQPAITSLQNMGLLGQVAGVKGLQAIKQPQLAAKMASLDIAGSQERARGYSEKPGEMIKEQVGATAELLLPALLRKAGPAIGGGKGILGKILQPRKTLAEAQKAYATGKAGVNISNILNAGKEYVSSDPGAKKTLKTVGPVIKSAKDAPELLKRLKVWGKAYTDASKVGKTSKAGLYDTLYKAGIEELKRVAPEAAQMRTLLGKTYSIPREVSKKATQALKVTALGRLLGF